MATAMIEILIIKMIIPFSHLSNQSRVHIYQGKHDNGDDNDNDNDNNYDNGNGDDNDNDNADYNIYPDDLLLGVVSLLGRASGGLVLSSLRASTFDRIICTFQVRW